MSNIELIREMNRAAVSNDPFKPVITLNCIERSECAEMLREMGVDVVPVSEVPNELNKLFLEV